MLPNFISLKVKKGVQVEEKELMPSAERCFASTTQHDLLLAAEAVVDAALWCHRLRSDLEISEDTRLMLIQAVYKDPSLTGALLTGDMFHFERC